MSYDVKKIVVEAVTTLLSSVTVGTDAIPFYTDYFGDVDEGIYFEALQIEQDDSKHWFGNMVTMDINTFSKGQNMDRTTAITRAVLLILKASVNSTIQLTGGWQATYTKVPLISSYHEFENGQTTHRDVIRFQIRVDEKSNNS
jgi:hypothetical protein